MPLTEGPTRIPLTHLEVNVYGRLGRLEIEGDDGEAEDEVERPACGG